MANQKELDGVYMQTALTYAKLSKAQRAQVGACLVTHNGVMLCGFNGTEKGSHNTCEEIDPNIPALWDGDKWQFALKTKENVIHAETNAVLKAAREGVSTLGGTIYVTLSPCVRCAAMLVNAGIYRLVYGKEYRDLNGVNLLKKAGVFVEEYKNEV